MSREFREIRSRCDARARCTRTVLAAYLHLDSAFSGAHLLCTRLSNFLGISLVFFRRRTRRCYAVSPPFSSGCSRYLCFRNMRSLECHLFTQFFQLPAVCALANDLRDSSKQSLPNIKYQVLPTNSITNQFVVIFLISSSSRKFLIFDDTSI